MDILKRKCTVNVNVPFAFRSSSRGVVPVRIGKTRLSQTDRRSKLTGLLEPIALPNLNR